MTLGYARALITGLGGQDGALLAAHLLRAGVDVIGTHRPQRAFDAWRLRELGIDAHPRLRLAALDPTDAAACAELVAATQPQALFHLAGQSRVAESFRDPQASLVANGLSTVHLLDAVRAHAPAARLVLAASAEIFGVPTTAPQDEATPLAPQSPYGLSKLLAHAAVGSWRASYGLRASSAILFNHESEWRDEAFVTRKLSRAVARIALGRIDRVELGNLDARRDFGYAPDHVAAMAAMAARDAGADYVLATGVAMSVRDFATAAFAAAGIRIDWFGEGADEVGVEHGSDRVRVRVDADLFRPVDAPLRVGDATKARRELGFAPSLDLAGLARRMVEADLARERA
ncbi:GDP-mannose 4,6-dehydratase [Dokdonella sp.]|uniref:GDP-mannose 4,6-dehydratase n=1 Tax=Dokdonella sp. TaxID=2291710 RepID=UPI001B024B31|nr:GDP-mannose 4,6-dehydratase [Dokdonella sp.]MBO9661414.1 GDP-mannose 4,6-dehydratase [Dokdonella sp.]